MVNKAKAKGTAGETALVRFCLSLGIPAKRKTLTGSMDEGDVDIGMPPKLAVEVKNCRTYNFPKWVDEATVEAENSGLPCIVVAKRNGKGDVGDWFVVMSVRQFFRWFKVR